MKLLISLLLLTGTVFSSEGDKHEGHEDETSAAVGPDKGLTEKGPAGLKISAEALQTIGIKTIDVNSDTIEIPALALVKVKDTKSIFRVRNNWYKRVEISILQKNSNAFVIKSSELAIGDKIVIVGVGFLRTAEVFSEEGATHSH